jgi:hypothetical protein
MCAPYAHGSEDPFNLLVLLELARYFTKLYVLIRNTHALVFRQADYCYHHKALYRQGLRYPFKK